MTDAPRLESASPADQIAETVRQGILEAVIAVVESEAYQRAEFNDQIDGFWAGLMVGVSGALISAAKDDQLGELRASIIAHLPYWFDLALEHAGKPPLGTIQ